MFIPREPIVVIYSLWKLCQTKESVVDGLSGILEMHDNFPPRCLLHLRAMQGRHYEGRGLTTSSEIRVDYQRQVEKLLGVVVGLDEKA